MTFEQYKIINDAYLDFYPDDRVDIQLDPYLSMAFDDEAAGNPVSSDTLEHINGRLYGVLKAVVWFPELTVTSEDGTQSHTIYDTYVYVSFPDLEIRLGRSTYTLNEIAVGYRHSHVCSGIFESMSRFCTGDASTPVNVIINKINNKDYTDFSLLIQSFIITVERMIRVESASGGPYIYMSRIGGASSPVPLSVFFQCDYMSDYAKSTREKIANFIEYYCSLNLDSFYYDGKCWQLSASDSEFITRATKVAKTFKNFRNSSFWNTNVYFYNGLYYNNTTPSRNFHVNTTVSWLFKGKRPTLKVKEVSDIKATSVTILSNTVLEPLYFFLVTFINSYYATSETHKDSLYSRAYKIKTALISKIRG